ncbi:unnamed protein product, partial [Phaeothamnion confervicola]
DAAAGRLQHRAPRAGGGSLSLVGGSSFAAPASGAHFANKTKLYGRESAAAAAPTAAGPTMAPSTPLPALNFSFACGGWLQFYMFGVCRCIQDHGLNHVSPAQQFVGSSAGGLAATALAVDADLYAAMDYCNNYAIKSCRASLLGHFKITRYMRACLAASAQITDTKAVALRPGRLQLAVTEVPSLRCKRITVFPDGESLVRTLQASGAAVPFASPIKIGDTWCVDGGLREFHPELPPSAGETVYVSAVYFSRADIKPSRYVPLWWAFFPPGDPATVEWQFDLGYRDALAYARGGGACSAADCTMRRRLPPHAFDSPRRCSFHRVVGYRAGSACLDILTVLSVVLLWKPVSFLLIYLELHARAALLAGRAAVKEVAPAAPLLLAVCALLLPPLLPATAAFAAAAALVSGAVLATTGCLGYCCGHVADEWRRLADHYRCIFSLSLFLRMLPVVGSGVQVRKHSRLVEQSMFYRIAVHIL